MLPAERTDFRPPFPLEGAAPEPRGLREFCGELGTASVVGLPPLPTPFPEPEGPSAPPASGPTIAGATSVALLVEPVPVGGEEVIVGDALVDVQLDKSEFARYFPSLPGE